MDYPQDELKEGKQHFPSKEHSKSSDCCQSALSCVFEVRRQTHSASFSADFRGCTTVQYSVTANVSSFLSACPSVCLSASLLRFGVTKSGVKRTRQLWTRATGCWEAHMRCNVAPQRLGAKSCGECTVASSYCVSEIL